MFGVGEGDKKEKKSPNHFMLINSRVLYGDWPGFYSRSQSLQNKGGPVEAAHTHWLGDCVAREEFKLRGSIRQNLTAGKMENQLYLQWRIFLFFRGVQEFGSQVI